MIGMLYVILGIFLMFHCVWNEPLLPSIAGKQNKVLFVYPINMQSERDLFLCPEFSACNIIHKRFWLPPIVERLCRCPQRKECPWIWSDDQDNYTMTLDNRSQIKFCSDLSELQKCGLKKPALKVVTKSPIKEGNDTVSAKHTVFVKPDKSPEQRNVTALCHCSDPHYWKLKVNSTKYDEETDRQQQTFFCSKLKKCSQSEFCGYVRADTYSTFYRCSCPNGHLCISQDKVMFKTEELLFRGFGYKAFCHSLKRKGKSKTEIYF